MRNIKTVEDLLIIMEGMYAYLEEKIDFDCEGWPIFKEDHFLSEWPKQVVTFQQRKNKSIANPSETLLCFFSSDERIYPRFINVFNEIEEYRKYMGVVGADVTFTRDMDEEHQMLIMLANQLFMAVLAANGIKIVCNTRSGGAKTNRGFRNIPNKIFCASGFLGCKNAKTISEVSDYINKILTLRPDKLIIYGKKDKLIEEGLRVLGINYKRVDDFHSVSKRKVV